jgi:hypothetical protein
LAAIGHPGSQHFLTLLRAQFASEGQPPLVAGRSAKIPRTYQWQLPPYSPRSWQWRKDWLDDVVDTVKYADVPYAYDASVDVVVHGIPVDTELLEKMILDTGRDVLTRLTTDFGNLDETVAGATWTYEHQRGAITTTIEFTRVEHTTTGLDRSVSMSPPGEIYSAEPEFDDVLQKIRAKAEKRQVERGWRPAGARRRRQPHRDRL